MRIQKLSAFSLGQITTKKKKKNRLYCGISLLSLSYNLDFLSLTL